MLTIILTISFLSWSEIISFADKDNDGVIDTLDNCPMNYNLDQADFDFDKLGNACDSDDDNDGIDDIIDFFDTNPNDWADFDFDGIGSVMDVDDDNDGILDSEDITPNLPSEVLTKNYLQDIQDCAKINDNISRLLCYSKFFEKVTENEEHDSDALELAITLSKLKAIDDCHFISHQIGHTAFVKYPDVIENLKGMDGSMCRGGYFHGVIASYFHNIKESGDSFPTSYNTMCDDLRGSSNYQDCLHGLGHGMVHYFDGDLNKTLEMCHEMSFYQSILCTKGVMMQFTDNSITRQGISKNTLSNLCNESELQRHDFVECNMSLGTTLSFFTNHDYEEGAKSCNLIENKESKKLCLEGLKLEIQDSENYEIKPLTENIREKYQPQKIDLNSIIDIRSPAIVSDFSYLKEIKMMQFSFDRPSYIIMYIPSDLFPEQPLITVNGIIQNIIPTDANLDGIVVIQLNPNSAGMVMIQNFKH